MPFELRVKTEFCASHHFLEDNGPCGRMHGHNFELEVFVRAEELGERDFAVDFEQIQAAADEIASKWDHRHLNDLPEFEGRNPTAELLAKFAFEALEEQLQGSQVKITKTVIWENRSFNCAYWRES